jgi:competence protein ComEA
MKKNLLSLVSMILFAVLSFAGVAQADTSTAPAAKPAASAAASAATAAPAAQTGAVNINTATAEELQKSLKGIGKVKAQAIVDYRASNGPFTTLDQLLEVKGIGKGTLEKNRDKISL